jgi:hypothetical protein
MKLRFHKKYVFSLAPIFGALARQDNVTIIDAKVDIFFYYRSFLEKHSNNFKTGTIQKNHIFKCDDFEVEELAMKCKRITFSNVMTLKARSWQ